MVALATKTQRVSCASAEYIVYIFIFLLETCDAMDQRPIHGFTNAGNTCFVNAALQLVFSSKVLMRRLQEHERECDEGAAKCAACAVLTDSWMLSSLISDEPTNVLHLLKAIMPHMVPGSQQDSNEFILNLLNAINANLLNPIQKGTVVRYTECKSCYSRRENREVFWGIDIPIRNTVEEALSEYYSVEVLEEVHCSKCGTESLATRSMAIETTPEVLIIQLARFQFGDQGSVRVRDVSAFPLRVDLQLYQQPRSPATLSPPAPARPARPAAFDCVGVVMHSGNSVNSGHYRAAAAVKQQWHLFDDSVVRPTTWAIVQKSEEAYFALYDRSQGGELIPAAPLERGAGFQNAMRSYAPFKMTKPPAAAARTYNRQGLGARDFPVVASGSRPEPRFSLSPAPGAKSASRSSRSGPRISLSPAPGANSASRSSGTGSGTKAERPVPFSFGRMPRGLSYTAPDVEPAAEHGVGGVDEAPRVHVSIRALREVRRIVERSMSSSSTSATPHQDTRKVGPVASRNWSVSTISTINDDHCTVPAVDASSLVGLADDQQPISLSVDASSLVGLADDQQPISLSVDASSLVGLADDQQPISLSVNVSWLGRAPSIIGVVPIAPKWHSSPMATAAPQRTPGHDDLPSPDSPSSRWTTTPEPQRLSWCQPDAGKSAKFLAGSDTDSSDYGDESLPSARFEAPPRPPQHWGCRLCGKTHFSAAALLRHEMRHSLWQVPDVRPKACRRCQQAFPTLQALHRHMRKHAGGQGLGQGADLSCPKCGDEYPDASLLRRHLEAHGKPQFQCRQQNPTKRKSPHRCRTCKWHFEDCRTLFHHRKLFGESSEFRETGRGRGVEDRPKKFCKACRKRSAQRLKRLDYLQRIVPWQRICDSVQYY